MIALQTVPSYLDDPHVRLMLRYRAGDGDALTELFSCYELPLRRFFHSRLGNLQVAEDAVQDVFVRVIRFKLRYVPVAKFSTWLFTIAVNIAKDRMREQLRLRHIHSTVHQFESCESSITLESTNTSEITDEMARLSEEILRLPERQSQAIVLYYLNSKSYEDIAQEMGSTKMGVKGLLARGRQMLRAKLELCDYSEVG